MASAVESERGNWRWWGRVGFRFAFLFWGNFCLLKMGLLWQVTWFLPWFNKWVLRWPMFVLEWPSERLTAWFTTHVFHLTGQAATRHPTGSGDTAQDWLGALSVLVLAVLGCAVWTAIAEWGIARRGWRREYRTLYAWLRLAMRFTLGSVLLSYGFSKVFDLQFSPPGSHMLNETYGDSSPMGLLWTFMGFSVPYTIFAGIAEVVPGVLLLFRRTMTIGALSAAAVMLNIVLLNFCYDVPVKLYSSTYLAMALFLVLPDVKPMLRFFVGNREARLHGVWLPPWERRPLRIAGYCLQALVVAHLLYANVSSGLLQWKAKVPAEVVAPRVSQKMNPQYANIDGSWVVDSSSGWPETQEWTSVTIGKLRYQSIDFLQAPKADGGFRNYGEWMDWQHQIHFLDHADSVLHWSVDANGNATLEGTWLGKPAKLTMHPDGAKADAPKNYPLMTRGFHWVQEMPYGR